MRLQWRGKAYKDLLWKAATATTVQGFDSAMDEVKQFNEGCYTWLKEIPPQHWSRSHFTGRCHTDVLLNNMCEVLNRQLVDGRDKPVITCLEYIRTYFMKRVGNVQKVIDKSCGPLTPTATKLLDTIKHEASQYIVEWNGGHKYQVRGPWNDQVVVDMFEKECSCRKWELTGIPCKHVVATIWYMGSNGSRVGIPESFVHPCYLLETWKQVYSFRIDPINGNQMWPKSQCPTTLTPPVHHIQPGRPKKKRKKGAEEASQSMVKKGKLSRSGKTVTCSRCKKDGHNSRGCKGQDTTTQTTITRRHQSCTICHGIGHNARGCKAQDVATQTKDKGKKKV